MIFEDIQDKSETINVKYSKVNSILKYLRKILNYKILIYTFILILTIGTKLFGLYPIPFVMLGVATIFNIPLLFPCIVTILGMLILRQPIDMVLFYCSIYLIYVAITIAVDINGITKKNIVAIKLSISMVVISVICIIMNAFDLEYISSKVSMILLTLTLYYIYIYGFYVLSNIDKKMMYAKEEISAMAVMLVISILSVSNIYSFGMQIWSTICIGVVVVLSYYRGGISGLWIGMPIGVIVSIVTGDINYLILMTSISIVTGLLSKLNKTLIFIAILLVTYIIQYITKGALTVVSPMLAETLIGGIILFLIPKKFNIALENIFDKNNTLKKAYEKELDVGSDIKNRLTAMSEVFDNLSSITLDSTEEDCAETQKVVEKYLLSYKESNCLNCSNWYYCMSENMDIITKYIARKLENNEQITKAMLPSDCEENDKMLREIKDIYNNIKLMRIIKAREKESNKKLANEYKEVAAVIKNMSNEIKEPTHDVSNKQKSMREELKFIGYTIYEDNLVETQNSKAYEFITDLLNDVDVSKREISAAVGNVLGEKMKIKLILNSSKNEKSRIKLISEGKFVIDSAVSQRSKTAGEKCGDTYYITETKSGNNFIAISDGMGHGKEASEVSKEVINVFDKLIKSGVESKSAAGIVNAVIKLKEKSNFGTTIDITIIDSEKEIMSIIKMGAAPTYILSEGKVEMVNQKNMPVGIVDKPDIFVIEIPIKKGMFIINISDGLDNEQTKKYINSISKKNLDLIPKEKIMESILDKTQLNKDDCTVIVTKIE